MPEKIIQIMPAPDNLYVIYEHQGDRWESKIVCFALWDNSDITMMEIDDDGVFQETASNVVGVIYK